MQHKQIVYKMQTHLFFRIVLLFIANTPWINITRDIRFHVKGILGRILWKVYEFVVQF